MASHCYGILPMAGKGVRLQPIAFSKELYPIVHRQKHYAVSEFCIRALQKANADEIKLVIHPEKTDLVKFYAEYNAPISMYFNKSKSQPESCFYPLKSMHDEDICLFGLPDTLFTPLDSFLQIRNTIENGADICLGLFEVDDGTKFDSVLLDDHDNVLGVKPKYNPPAYSNYIWGIWGARVKTVRLLQQQIDNQITETKSEKILGVGFDDLAKKNLVNFKAIKFGKNYYDIGSIDAVIHAHTVINNFDFENDRSTI